MRGWGVSEEDRGLSSIVWSGDVRWLLGLRGGGSWVMAPNARFLFLFFFLFVFIF